MTMARQRAWPLRSWTDQWRGVLRHRVLLLHGCLHRWRPHAGLSATLDSGASKSCADVQCSESGSLAPALCCSHVNTYSCKALHQAWFGVAYAGSSTGNKGWPQCGPAMAVAQRTGACTEGVVDGKGYKTHKPKVCCLHECSHRQYVVQACTIVGVARLVL